MNTEWAVLQERVVALIDARLELAFDPVQARIRCV